MRIVVLLVLVISFLVSCGPSRQETLLEIKQLEYLRWADEARFVGWLNSDDSRIRQAAVESLGRIQDTTTVAWVVNLLSDPDDSVRSAAAFAVGQFFTPIAEKPLQSLMVYEKNLYIKGRMIEALGKVGTDFSSNSMRGFIENNDPETIKPATLGCGIMAYRGYPLHELANRLGVLLGSDQDREIRWRAAYALYRMGSPTEFPALVTILNDGDDISRFFSLRAQQGILTYVLSPQSQLYRQTIPLKNIQNIITSRDYLDLLSRTLQDTCWYIRLATLQLLEVLKSPLILPEVKKAVSDSVPHIRSAALKTLFACDRKAGSTIARNLLSADIDWREKGEALLLYSGTDPAASLQIISRNQKQTSWPENYYLIRVLDNIETASSTRILQQLAETDNRAQLSLVLESLVNRSGIPLDLYLDKLALADPAVTTIIASKLAKIKDTTTVGPLLQAYTHFQAPRDSEPMLAILETLDSLASPATVEFLRQQLTNPFPPIRLTAHRILDKITHQVTPEPAGENGPLTRFDFPVNQIPDHPTVRFTTSRGIFEIRLFPEKAPVTVANFIRLVKNGFYDGIYFHRVVPGFVIQAGDPRGDGWGGPGYSIPCEYNDFFYQRGTVGMAHAGKDTGGSQFFITHTPQPHLNGRHTAFGMVTSGWEVIDHIQIYDRILKTELLNSN